MTTLDLAPIRARLEGFACGPFKQSLMIADISALLAEVTALRAALAWYVETDETNLSDPENQFYIDGQANARALLPPEGK